MITTSRINFTNVLPRTSVRWGVRNLLPKFCNTICDKCVAEFALVAGSGVETKWSNLYWIYRYWPYITYRNTECVNILKVHYIAQYSMCKYTDSTLHTPIQLGIPLNSIRPDADSTLDTQHSILNWYLWYITLLLRYL